ncbi:MAG: hypothetical protein QNK23_08105 [Crocinitomicaceae bacterium]|nr:hypothetical protein [Crocinitomicaceae bacterium]
MKQITLVFILLFAQGAMAQTGAKDAINLGVIDNYVAPDDVDEKLADLEKFREFIANTERENEEWNELLENLASAQEGQYDGGVYGLTEIAAKLKKAVKANVRKWSNIADYESGEKILTQSQQEQVYSQYNLELAFLSRISNLLPKDLLHNLQKNAPLKTMEVRKLMGRVRSTLESIIKNLSSNGKDILGFTASAKTEVGMSDLRFRDEYEIDNLIESLKVILSTNIPKQLEDYQKEVEIRISGNIQAIKFTDEKIKKLTHQTQKADINMWAIWMGIPAFCLTILLLYLLPEWLNRRRPDADRDYSVLLELITVLLLTMTILILGLSGKISEEVLGTLIGGISGYVLNKGVKAAKEPRVTTIIEKIEDK